MSKIILVHGAWHGAWSWEFVSQQLRKAGRDVIAPDLPGHGEDRRPLRETTMEAYVDRIAQVVSDEPEPVVLVGHSMSGAVIGQVADRCSGSIRRLVYVCAFLLPAGASVLGTMEEDSGGQLGPRLAFNEDQSGAAMDDATLREVFYNETPEDRVRWAEPQLLEYQSVAPLAAPVELPLGRFDSVPRAYVKCSRDRILSPAAQDRMISGLPCDLVLELDTDHAPFLSRPNALAAFLTTL